MNLKLFIFGLYVACLGVGCGGDSGGTKSTGLPLASSVSSPAVSSLRTASSSRSSQGLLSSSLSSSNLSSSSGEAISQRIAYGNHPMQIGELRVPLNRNVAPLPLVIIVHGGCWVSAYADYHFMDDFAQAITDLGYATWNIEYRALGTGGEWPVMFEDVSKAADYVRTLAQRFAVDADNVAVIGHSAGGHIALWLASRHQLQTNSALYVANPLAIRGVISLAGISNLTANNGCSTLANNIIGTPVSQPTETLSNRLLETSPSQMLPIGIKTMLISGSGDTIVPAFMGVEYANQASAKGDNSAHYTLQGASHFDLIHPQQTDWLLYQNALQQIFTD